MRNLNKLLISAHMKNNGRDEMGKKKKRLIKVRGGNFPFCVCYVQMVIEWRHNTKRESRTVRK